MRYSSIFFLFLTFFFAKSVNAQVEGWWHTCMAASPIIQEILIDGCGTDAKSEHVLLKTGKSSFNLKNYHLKVSNPLLKLNLGEVVIQPNSTNFNALNYLNNSYKGCYFGDVFVDAQSQQVAGLIPPESSVLIFNDKINTDVYYLNDVVLKNWCSSKIFVAFGTVLNTIPSQSLFKNYTSSGNCLSDDCLRQIEINLEPNNSFCEKIIYDVSKLPHSVKNPPASEGKGSYITSGSNNSVNYLGGSLYGLSACVPEKLFDNSDCVSNPLDYKIKIDSFFEGSEKKWRIVTDTSNLISPSKIKWNGSGLVDKIDSITVSMPQGNYTLQISDGRTCNNTQNLSLGATLAFSVKISGTDTVCAGTTDVLTATVSEGTSPVVVDWFDSNGNAIQSTGLSCSPIVNSNTFFVAKATDNNGLIAFDTFRVATRALPKPKMSLNSPTTVCNDAVVEFYGAGAQTYTWSTNPSIAAQALNKTTGDTVKLFALYLPAPGYTITLNGTDKFGCTNRVDTVIKVIPIPRSTITPIPDTICTTDAPIKIMGTADAGKDYGNNNLSLASENYTASCGACLQGVTFNPKLATVGKNLVYHEAINNYGCVNKVSIEIYVKNCTCTNPASVVAGNDISICKISSIALNGSAQNIKSSKWSTDGSGSFTDSSNLKTNYTPSSVDSSKGTVKIYLASTKTSFLGCQNVLDSFVLKFGLPSKASINRVICANDSFKVSKRYYKMSGTYLDTLVSFNGCDSIVQLQLSVLKNDNTNVNSTTCDVSKVGTKSVTLKNMNGCDSVVTTVTTLSKTDSTFQKATSCDITKAGIKTVTFRNVNGCDSVVTTVTTFSKSDSTFITKNTCNSLQTGVSTLKLVNSGGCDSIVVIKTIYVAPDTTYINKIICLGDSVLVAGKYFKTQGVFSSTLRSIQGCDSIVNLQLTIIQSDTTQTFSFSCSPRDTGVFVSRFTNANCTGVLVNTVKLQKLDTVFVKKTICNGDSVLLAGKYFKSQGNFSLTLKTTLGCDSIVTLQLSFFKTDTTKLNAFTCRVSEVGTFYQTKKNLGGCDSIIQTIVQLKNSTLRFGLAVTKIISCNAGNDGAVNWVLPKGGVAPYSAKWSNGDVTDTSKNLKSGLYVLTLTDSKGCAYTDSIQLDQPDGLTANFTIKSPLCYSDAVGTVTLNKIDNANGVVKVIFSNVTYDSIKTPFTFNNVSIGVNTFGIIDKNKCRKDTTINVPSAPSRQFNLGGKISIDLGDSAFIGSAINFSPQSVKWSPSIGLSCDACLNPIAKPVANTTYTVILKDSLGCTLSDAITITIGKKRSVFVPNTFSPNGDNVNDVFTPYADKTVDKIAEFSVFNRWGEKVYSLQNYVLDGDIVGWHGDFKGLFAPAGVYTYIVNVLYKDGKTEIMHGDVNLVR